MSENSLVAVAKRPPTVSEQDEVKLQQTAAQISQEISTAGDDFAVSAIMRRFGAEVTTKMEAVNRRVGKDNDSLLKTLGGKGSPIEGHILELREVMEGLNPHAFSKAWYFGWLPTWLKSHLVRRFAGRWQSQEDNIQGIVGGLRAGQDQLLETTLDMHGQFKELQEAQAQVCQWIYVGELAWTRLKEIQTEAQKAADESKVGMLEGKLARLARRIRDLRTMEQANNQFALTITQGLETNDLLAEQVASAILVGPAVLDNGLRIYAALVKQKQVAQALDKFQGTLGNLMVGNATALEQQATQIGDLYNNPVIALDKLEAAHQTLMKTVNNVQGVIKRGTEQARLVSAKLAEMSEAMAPVVASRYQALDQVTEPESALSAATEETKPQA